MRFGYALVLVTVGLMIWASAVGAVKLQSHPCVFNSLCTCSGMYPDNYGSVECENVPFPSMPIAVNTSKVYKLKMHSTGLLDIEPYFLLATGLYRLEITNNPIYDIADDAFRGLERSLWELVLKSNSLIDVPTRAIRSLTNLRLLDLSGNEITNIQRESFRGLQNNLKHLILSDNSISIIPIDAFHGLPNLISIDLSSNNLHEITPDVFREQMNSLVRVNFADNLLKEIPYIPLSMLKALRFLDVSSNRITGFQVTSENQPLNIKLALDQLHLEYNEINNIMPGAFQYFLTVNETFLDFNPIHLISDNAFKTARIRELYIRHCKLDYIEPEAFSGLESSLTVLDLSGNNITTLPVRLFSSFDLLGEINVKDNKLISFFPQTIPNVGAAMDVYKLDLTGDRNAATSLQSIRKLDKLRFLTIGKLMNNQLSPEDFLGFSMTLENLRINHANLRGIKPHAFLHTRGIKRLDLSENNIDNIEKGAFQEIGHSLISLKIAHGLSSLMTQLPDLRDLTSLKELDLSNNRLKSIGDNSFHFLKNLQVLELDDNQIELLAKGTFQRDIHQNLLEVSMEFNSLKHISTHSFVDLEVSHWRQT
jgi:Leucine-rich repeat (LRR) protein